ncbi:hypothetical protein RAD16_40995, partial [Bradyrhizobium sp. 18BD]
TLSQLENATLEFIVAGSEHDINMVEGESKEIQEAELVEAIKFAHTAIKLQCLAQKELTAEVGKTVKRTYSHEHSNEDLKKAIYAATYDQVYAIASSASAKDERGVKFKEVRDAYIETLGEIDDVTKFLAKKYYHDVEYDAIRNLVLDEGKRLD